MESQSKMYVGFDIGGTKTSVAYRHRDADAEHIIRFSTHGANYHRANASQVIGVIAASLARIREEAHSDAIIYSVAGVAGAGRSAILNELNQGFVTARTNPLDRFEAHSDAVIALEGAFSGRAGTILIAGTGSGIFANTDTGDFLRAGGWGARLGDPGSGEQIGRRAARAICMALDGGKSTSLSEILSERLTVELEITDRDGMIAAVNDENLKFSTLAPFVFEAAENGDEVAIEILRTEATELAREAGLVLDQLDNSRLAFMGGLCQNPLYRSLLEKALTTENPNVEFTDPDHPPEIGALRLAEALSGTDV
ncbi:MAG: hypothetical protein IH853_00900 [Bacteroidetes bacterium]|nr:hypothetical protein [Bacteroidota bacterium]